MNLRRLYAIVMAVTLSLSPRAFSQTQESAVIDGIEPMSVSASYSNAGPYGVLWTAYLAPDGDLSVRVSHELSNGQTTSQYFANKDRVSLLRRAIGEVRFFHLPNEIAPTFMSLHRPHYRLTVTLGVKQHSVVMYDPTKIGPTDEVKRFFAAWDALFSKLPFRPEVEVVR
jgi:hypothetical protein